MSDKLILILNCGSSSLKGAVIDNDSSEIILSCLAEKLTNPDAFITFKFNGEKHVRPLENDTTHTGAVQALLEELKTHDLDSRIGAIGHRIVSGGELYKESILIDDAVIDGIEKCIPLAPLHNPAHLLGLRAAIDIFKGLPNVAVFDTSFHQTMPERAYTYAIPYELYEKHALRRYGAHGTSYRFVAEEATRVLNKDKKDLRMVICHLGNGASITAVADGKSQDTSMGLTPLEGLVMGTRSGDIDPSVFSFLEQNLGMNIQQITDLLNKKSGLLGLSGLSNDCRTIEENAAKGHKGAQLALEVFTYRLAKYVASMTVAAGGLDALVFTGGIGENSSLIRSKVLALLGFLGLKEDPKANEATRFGQTGIITTPDSQAVAVVIPTNEELMIAHDTVRLSGL